MLERERTRPARGASNAPRDTRESSGGARDAGYASRDQRGRDTTTGDYSRSRQQDRGRPRSSSPVVPRYLTREDTRASARGRHDSSGDQSFDPYDQQDQPRSNVGSPAHPPTAAVEAETAPAVQQAELVAVQAELRETRAQLATALSNLDVLERRMTACLETLLDLQKTDKELAGEQTKLRAELAALQTTVQELRQEHLKLEKDHKRVLGILRENKMEPPSKRHRGNDTDGDAQRKT